MAINKKSRDTMVATAVVIAVAATIMINLLADRKFARLDMTSEGRFSISAPFREIMKKLTDPMKVTYYISGTVPGWFEVGKRDMLDKLREIETASNGMIELEVIDPTDNKELRERLHKEGAELQLQEMGKDQVQVMITFSALEMTYQAKPKQFIKAFGQAEGLEYVLGSKILELTQGEKKPIVAVMAPKAPEQPPMMQHQPQQGSGYEWLQHGGWEGANKFDVKPVELTESSNIPAETTLLILVRPKALNERQRYEVVKYLAGGGRVLLLASPFKVSHEYGWRAEKTPTGLEDYLSEVGVTFGPDFLCDLSNLKMPKSLNLMTGEVEYSQNPFFIRILQENIDQESVLTRLMPGLMMPSPGEIRLDSDKIKKADLSSRVLARTSKQTWTIPFTEQVDPEKEVRTADRNRKDFTGPKIVFAELEGQFPFVYDGKPVPEWPADDKDKNDKKEEKKTETASVTKKPGSIIICSCPEAFHAMYLKDRNVGQFMQVNDQLIVNIIETSSLGKELVELRTQSYETRTIDKLVGAENDAKRNLIKFVLIGGMPLLVIGAALARTLMRRATQTRYERKFAQTTGPSSFTP